MDYLIAAGFVFVFIILLSSQGHILNAIKRTDNKLNHIIHKENAIVTTLSELTDQINRISADVDAGNASLTAIQSDIADLKEQIASGGLTAEEEAAVSAQIAELETKVSDQAARLAAIDDETPGASGTGEPTPV